MTEDLRKRLSTVGERLKDYHYAYGELSEQLVALAEALEDCKKYQNMIDSGCDFCPSVPEVVDEALRSLETFLGEGENTNG